LTVTYLQRDINATDSIFCILSIDSDIFATPLTIRLQMIRFYCAINTTSTNIFKFSA